MTASPIPQFDIASQRHEPSPARALERIEEATDLRRELELRNWALHTATAHFMITDLGREGWPILFVNRALAQDYGYDPEELIGRSPAILLEPAGSAGILAEIMEAMRAGASVRRELRARRKDGSSFWTGVSLTPMRNRAGLTTHYVSIGADITARLAEAETQARLQRQLFEEMQERERMAIKLRFAQKLESVGRLAAGIAHEINTPIQYVGDSIRFLQDAMGEIDALLQLHRGLLSSVAPDAALEHARIDLLQAEEKADLAFLRTEVPKAFERTLDGVARVTDIVRAMKEFAHPDAKEHAYSDLNHAIETTLVVARSEYKYCAAVETQYSSLPEVMCNAGELNQVFLNLIINAAHAIEESGKDATSGRIRISTGIEQDLALIEIADNGCGIPAANLERIFDPFFTTKEVGRGTGQGLAIARAIVVEKHGGSIDIESIPGSGSRFILKLPISGRAREPSA